MPSKIQKQQMSADCRANGKKANATRNMMTAFGSRNSPEIYADGQQHQAGGQQILRRYRVELRGITGVKTNLTKD